ncbi:hypothetical protein TNCV_4520691 [Trichonephila clavipes]|nr:hypothetical protein TNCV_4520691 [Trichonephila clavipes]
MRHHSWGTISDVTYTSVSREALSLTAAKYLPLVKSNLGIFYPKLLSNYPKLDFAGEGLNVLRYATGYYRYPSPVLRTRSNMMVEIFVVMIWPLAEKYLITPRRYQPISCARYLGTPLTDTSSPDLLPIQHIWDIKGHRFHVLLTNVWQMIISKWPPIPRFVIRMLTCCFVFNCP